MRAKPALILLLVLAVLGLVVWQGIHSRIASASAVKERTEELAVPTVAVIHAKPGALKDEVVLPGSVQAFTDAPIYARASGYLKRWYVDIGTRVKAGQVLAEIEAPELDQQVIQARAALQQARAALQQSEAGYEQGKANEGMSQVTAKRWQDLAARGVVSRQENDQYQAQLQSQVANSKALNQAISAARSNVSSMDANLKRLEELQNYKTVRAPFSGVITARNTDVGALINGGNGSPMQELFHLAATQQLRVFVSVPQAYSRTALPGVPADLTLAEFPGRRFHGKLVRTAEAMDPATRTLLSEVDVDNASGELRAGAYAEVHLRMGEATASLLLPVSAIIFRAEGPRVALLRGNKAELVPVTLGKDYGTEVEIAAGLSASDSVIVNPPDSLTSGAVVRVAAG